MVKKGALDKYGKNIEGVTPKEWKENYVDYKDEGAPQKGLISVSTP